ncbi:MAG: antibiotic biosynthesis monooxygenase family protein [Caldilineaceae bacterium]
MIARVITFQLQSGKTAEMLEIANNSVVPLMQQQSGCRLITMLSDGAADKVLAVGLWESAADLQANEQSGMFQEQLAKVKHLCTLPPVRELYEVSFQTAPI